MVGNPEPGSGNVGHSTHIAIFRLDQEETMNSRFLDVEDRKTCELIYQWDYLWDNEDPYYDKVFWPCWVLYISISEISFHPCWCSGDENTGEAIEQPLSQWVNLRDLIRFRALGAVYPSRNARLNNCDAGKICNVYQFLLCYLGRNCLKGQSLFTVETKCLYTILSGCVYTANTFYLCQLTTISLAYLLLISRQHKVPC